MIEVQRESFDVIGAYAQVPTAFLVTSVLEPTPNANAGSEFSLKERVIGDPYIKNYDAISGNRPTDWSTQFDTATWQIFSAFDGAVRVGGAIAFVTSSADIRHKPYADLWDLRVDPARRRAGYASALFHEVERWAGEKGCAALRIETQHINVAACRFYEQQGCTLHSVRAGAYPEFPGEIRLIWQKSLND
jgi:ribosomal protein S18 acetylase RimI-like enzyme